LDYDPSFQFSLPRGCRKYLEKVWPWCLHPVVRYIASLPISSAESIFENFKISRRVIRTMAHRMTRHQTPFRAIPDRFEGSDDDIHSVNKTLKKK